MIAHPALVAALLCSARVFAQNLIVNSSFEDGPPVSGGYLPLNIGSTVMPGWIVTRGQIDLTTSFWQQIDGNRSLDLNGSPGSGGVLQTFATLPSREYTLSFFLAGNPGGGPAIKILWISVADQFWSEQFDTSSTSNGNMKWTKHSRAFRAAGEVTALEFYSGNPISLAGPALDNIAVVPAPCTGDFNHDSQVDDDDFVIFVAAYNILDCADPAMPAGCPADVNHDRVVDDTDFVAFVGAYNSLLCP